MEELRTQVPHRCVSRFSGLGASAFYRPQLLTSQLTPCGTEALSCPWLGTEDLPWTSARDCTWQPPPSPCPTMDAQMPPGVSSSGGSPTCKSPTSCGLLGLLPGCVCSSRLLSSLAMAPPTDISGSAHLWVPLVSDGQNSQASIQAKSSNSLKAGSGGGYFAGQNPELE